MITNTCFSVISLFLTRLLIDPNGDPAPVQTNNGLHFDGTNRIAEIDSAQLDDQENGYGFWFYLMSDQSFPATLYEKFDNTDAHIARIDITNDNTISFVSLPQTNYVL